MRILYNAFNGRYADSPRALHRGLLARGIEAEHVWLQDERFVGGFPAGVTTVPIGTPAAVAALESADVLISNTHIQLDRWRKPAGAFYLQTWHGTPLKRIHRAAASIPAEEMMRELDADIASWDALVSQSPAATVLLRDAFGYAGPVLETGYPRNDVLRSVDAEERRTALRDELGIGPDVTAVLYAPTYRDDTVDDADAPDGLDLELLLERLGPGFTVLLRQHYYLYRRPVRTGVAGLVDVSDNPDIAELYLAADTMVTDYSSAMFDFAVTGKPLLLYPYDLAHYRDRLRGFTFELDA
ncbi:MAG: CDP-glycerol glycerophosphotransferase family protein, partial [Janthinobacterium lividum]